MEDKLTEKLVDMLEKVFDEKQNKPNQYIVAYYRMKDDTLLGYHLSTFCQLTQDILKAKRYNGENPTSQLQIIRKNLDYTLDITEESAEKALMGGINLNIKNKYFEELEKSDVYIDAIPLEEGTPKQKFGFKII